MADVNFCFVVVTFHEIVVLSSSLYNYTVYLTIKAY